MSLCMIIMVKVCPLRYDDGESLAKFEIFDGC